KMQPPCENPALAAAVAAADSALRRSPSAREPEREQPPASLRPRLKDLPALLRSGLTLRRKRSAAGGRVSARAHPPGDYRGRLEVREAAEGAPFCRTALKRSPGRWVWGSPR
ncbi:Hypothetical predicted protein, partial [Marmota monax]